MRKIVAMAREARAKPINYKADLKEALILVGVVLFMLGVLVGMSIK